MTQSTKRPNLQKRMVGKPEMARGRATNIPDISGSKDALPSLQSHGTATNQRRYPLMMVVAVLLATLIASFQHFVLTLPQATTGQIQFTDGIVVMTGGQQRLDDGVRLLTQGFADKMLISGVGKGVNRAILVQALGLSEAQINALFCCVELDHAAQDTFGNAKSTANGHTRMACNHSGL